MRKLACLTAVACLAALAAAPLGGAADRMWIGFHDDPSFRWEADRTSMLDRARAANATMFRAVVTWADVARTRPANATNPFDPAYRLDDVDQLVRDAQARGMEVLLTIWGTPKWANGNKGPAYMPRNTNDLENFARALASRYSGRYADRPFVRFWSVWNESNLQLFLAPQFDSAGRSVAPRNYARLYAAAYAGIKAGNPRALVGIGETSSAGRDKPLAGKSGTHSPGRFAQLVAKANPRLKFDAWAHHPYPVPVRMKPTQKVRWPNVSLASLPQFEKSLDTWFKRRNIPIWITEYGHETRPAEKAGVTEAQQASYIKQSISLARKDPRVQMFIWFVFQDTHDEPLAERPLPSERHRQAGPSGLRGRREAARRSQCGHPREGRDTADDHHVRAGVRGAPTGPERRSAITYRLMQGTRPITVEQPQSLLGVDGWIRFRLDRALQKGATYTMAVEANDINGNKLRRTLTLKGT